MTRTLDVTNLLQTELIRRCQNNPKYSLRAFANNLGISPANLSLILNKKRPPSQKTIDKILRCNTIASFSKGMITADLMSAREDNENLSLDDFEKINSWKAYAILGLLKTKSFNSNVTTISARLGLTTVEVKYLIELLIKSSLIEKSGSTLKRSKGPIRINNKVSSANAKVFQRELVIKALESMENEPFENRDLSSITFVMSRDKMEIAKAEIRKFRLKMAQLFEQDPTADDVYSLTVQFAPLTKPNLRGQK